MPRRSLLALGLLLAAIPVAGCGKENPELIPQDRASALTSTIDEIKAACDANDTAKAKAAVEAANQQVSELPRRVDAELKRNVRQWLINPGSTGQPRDGDPRAAWLMLDTDRWTASYRRAEYDIAGAQAAIRAANLPDSLAERLQHGQ